MKNNYHRNTSKEEEVIKNILRKYSINVNEQGIISYVGSNGDNVLPNCSLYFMRHADTFATSEGLFMSDDSENSHISLEGIEKIHSEAPKIDSLNIDLMIYSGIIRVQETAEEIRKCVKNVPECILLPWLKGINNEGWEKKRIEELIGEDAIDFKEREIRHNIFAKSSKGTSWGEVLVNADNLIEYMNENCSGKRVLLISQESLIYSFKMLTRQIKKPWDGYETIEFFGFNKKNGKKYGSIQRII